MDLDFDFEADIDAKDALKKANLQADGIESSEKAQARGRHSIVCKHWLRNLCMKGDKCDFLHQYDPSRMPECVFWLKFARCSDPDCVFRHVTPGERPECQRYKLGFCKLGPLCRSRHDRQNRDQLPELLPDWFLDTMLANASLVPRLSPEESRKLETDSRRDRERNGIESSLSLVPMTELGTIPGVPPPIHGKCRVFIIRSMTVRNVQISCHKGIWATSIGNTQRLRQSFKEVDHVILMFSATESRNFQGYGKMISEPDDMLFPGIWGDISCRLGPNFRVHWIKQCSMPLSHADHIKNPKNEDLPVRRSRDGQELPSEVGERLGRLLWQQSDTDLLRGTEWEAEERIIYDPTTLAILSNGKSGQLALTDGKKDNGSGDADKDANEEDKKDDGGNSRQVAPVVLGTFKDEKDGKKRRPGLNPNQKPANAVTVGKALASGSSSILAAVAEDNPRPAGMGPGPPAPGTMGWTPPPTWHGAGPGYDPYNPGPPPARPNFPMGHPGGYPVPGGYPPQYPPHPHHPHMGHYPGHPPPGYPMQRPPPMGGPPQDWQGASSGPGGEPLAIGDKRRKRSRSRSKKKKHKHR